MATLASALLKAIHAQDDDFAKAILLRESLTGDEVQRAINEMSEEECDSLYDVLARLTLQEPYAMKPSRWLAALEARKYEGKGDSKQALETLFEYEASLQPHIIELHNATSTCLENVILRVQTDAIRKAKSRLARGARDSEPLLKYTVKH